MRLVRKLVLAIFLAFLPAVGIVEYISFTHEMRLSTEDSRHDLALLGRFLEGEIARNWAANPTDAVQLAIAAAKTTEPLVSVIWIPEGEPELHADRTRVEVRIPVVVDGVRRGTIAISESGDRLRAFIRARVAREAALTGALLLVSLAIAFALGTQLVGARLARLVQHSRRIASGDLGGQVEVGGRDEIAELAEQMNAMSGALASAHARVENANSERVQASAQLRHADRLASIGRLASAFAHELGTPLNVVLGRAKLISDPDTGSESAAENAEIIREQAQRMVEAIRGLLGFARRAPGPAARVDLRDIARQGIGLLEPLARHKSITLLLHDAGDAACVSGQRSEVEQIVTNLVTNAIDAMEGGGTVDIDVSTMPGKSLSRPVRADAIFHRLTIRDEGPGIPDVELARVFEPFYTTKVAGRGTGLGLWIVDGIVRDHGGWIEVESRLGAGTSFCVYLPAAES